MHEGLSGYGHQWKRGQPEKIRLVLQAIDDMVVHLWGAFGVHVHDQLLDRCQAVRGNPNSEGGGYHNARWYMSHVNNRDRHTRRGARGSCHGQQPARTRWWPWMLRSSILKGLSQPGWEQQQLDAVRGVAGRFWHWGVLSVCFSRWWIIGAIRRTDHH